MPFRRLALLVGTAYLASVGFMVWLAVDPRTEYFEVPTQRAAWTVPWPALAFLSLVMFGEALVVLAALDPRFEGPLWRRATLGAAALAVWAVPSTFLGFLHAPGYLIWHAVWVWAQLAVVTASAACSLVLAGARRLSGALARRNAP